VDFHHLLPAGRPALLTLASFPNSVESDCNLGKLPIALIVAT
jgi:hypothetical protein